MPTVWTEGTTERISWTASDSPQTVTYEAQFSAAGTFSGDEFTIFKTVSALYYDWAIPTNVVSGDTATCKIRVRARTADDNVSAWSTSQAFTLQNAVSATPVTVDVDPIALSATFNDVRVKPPFITAFAINNGDPSTGSQDVTLNISAVAP